jgi:mono/diheme cytochrome c family protein
MNNVMPGIKDHPELSDKKIANLLSFVRNSFGKEPVNIKPELIQEMKKLTPEGGIFTEKSVKDYLKLN